MFDFMDGGYLPKSEQANAERAQPQAQPTELGQPFPPCKKSRYQAHGDETCRCRVLKHGNFENLPAHYAASDES